MFNGDAVMVNKKVNLYLDDELVKEARKIAIDNSTSVSKLVTEFLQDYVASNKNNKDKQKP